MDAQTSNADRRNLLMLGFTGLPLPFTARLGPELGPEPELRLGLGLAEALALFRCCR